MRQMLYQFQGNQRDYFSNDTFRGRSLVSSAVYYEVTPLDTSFRCDSNFGGVTERQDEVSKVAIAEMFDEVQARINADYELAARMTQEEQEMYTFEERARQQKRIQDFTPMDSEKEAHKPEEKTAEYEKEKEELRLSLKIIPNDDSKVDYEPLSRKFPIVN
ncbi:hypothetical protein Tco_0126099 [Tanacetum coccineum]